MLIILEAEFPEMVHQVHFKLQAASVQQLCARTLCCFSCVQLFVTPWTIQPARLLCPWNFSGRNIEVGCYFLLQGIFPTQESNLSLLRLPHWQTDSLPPHHLGSPITTHSQHIFFFSCDGNFKSTILATFQKYITVLTVATMLCIISPLRLLILLYSVWISLNENPREVLLQVKSELQGSDSELGYPTQLLRNSHVCPL